jgi:hypothetical protein
MEVLKIQVFDSVKVSDVLPWTFSVFEYKWYIVPKSKEQELDTIPFVWKTSQARAPSFFILLSSYLETA